MPDQPSVLLNELSSELEQCRQLSQETPLVNPYQQLSYRLLKQMFADDLNYIPENLDDTAVVRGFARHMVYSRASDADLPSLILRELDQMISLTKDDNAASRLIIFRALGANFRAGFSHAHFRLNAVQLHNAIRPMEALEKDPDDASSRRYMTAASKLLDHITSETIG